MNLLILDAGHSFDTKGKNNLKENCRVENIDGQIMSFLSIKTI